MFHLFTHAFFKALLFLGAGSVMHAMGNVVDMRRFGGLRHVLPWTHRTFLVGSLALAGIFPFAGFWSKDQILASVHAQTHLHAEAAHGGTTTITAPRDATRNVAALSRASSAASTGSTNWVPAEYRASIFRVLYFSSLFTAFLTAFYTFRAYYLTFFGPLVIPSEAGHHAHESPPRMWGPLVVLAVFAFGIGFVWELNDVFSHFLSTTPSMAHLVRLHGAAEAEFHMNIALLSTVVALIGIGFASFYYLGDRREIARLAQRLGWLRLLSYHKFFVDELYQILFVWPLQGIGRLSYFVDRRLIDGVVDLTGCLPVWLGAGARRWQTGLVPFYGLMMATGMVVILVLGGWFWWGG
jgi:NADH-quinone oxidoreductase subunit L